MRLIDAEMIPWENQHMDEYGDWYLNVDEIEQMPTIDPVHAAGGCYCDECKNSKRIDGFGLTCIIHNDPLKNIFYVVDGDYFCKSGKRK